MAPEDSGIPFAFTASRSDHHGLVDGVLFVNCQGTPAVRVTRSADAVLASVDLGEPVQRCAAFAEVEAAVLCVLGVDCAATSEVFEATLNAELESMLFCVRKYQRVRCGTVKDAGLALGMVMDELFPFLSRARRADLISWYVQALRGRPQDLVFVLRKVRVRCVCLLCRHLTPPFRSPWCSRWRCASEFTGRSVQWLAMPTCPCRWVCRAATPPGC